MDKKSRSVVPSFAKPAKLGQPLSRRRRQETLTRASPHNKGRSGSLAGSIRKFRRKWLKRLVGERGFEPPTPWSRTRFQRLLNSIEICRPQTIDVEGFAATAPSLVDLD